MYNPGFDDDLYHDRNQSFRKAVRAPRKNQRYMTNQSPESHQIEDVRTDEKPQICYVNETVHKQKYNWKHFLPFTTKSTGWVLWSTNCDIT